MNVRCLNDLNFRLNVEDISGLPSAVHNRLRRECQTNLRFLANCVMRPRSQKFMSLSESCHGPLINSFLPMNPEVSFEEWSVVKERVSLASRGILKSTVVASFIVQAQLCDPDVRILVTSGKLPLAKSIMETSRQPFASNEVIQFLFPEYSVREEDITGDSFICPRRDPGLNLRDPTLSIATFESVKAGGHYELLVFDDCTNEINCASVEMAEKCEGFYDDTDPLVEPGGYRHFLGTRWAPDDVDIPEVLRRRGLAYQEEHGGEVNTSYFCMPAWTLREGNNDVERLDILERDKKYKLRPDDVILTWPEKLSAKFLWPKYRAKPEKFLKQYLLRWVGKMTSEAWSETLLNECVRPYAEGIPLAHDRFIVVLWDPAGIYSAVRDRRASDLWCGFAVMFELSTKRMFIYDAVLEIFLSSTEAAMKIIEFYQRQLRVGKVVSCDVEDSSGIRMLEGEIMSIAKKANVPIQMRYWTVDTAPGAKATRISKLVGATKRGLLQFSATLPQKEDILRQFEKWDPKKKVKDDAPDCAGLIWDHYADKIYPGMVQNMTQSDQTVWAPEAIPVELLDPHADERECADIAWLSSMTAPHA